MYKHPKHQHAIPPDHLELLSLVTQASTQSHDLSPSDADSPTEEKEYMEPPASTSSASSSRNASSRTSDSASSSLLDFDRHLRLAEQKRQPEHEWHEFLAVPSESPTEDTSATLAAATEASSDQAATTTATVTDTDTDADADAGTGTLLSVTAEALADVLRASGATSVDPVVYDSFIRTLVDCAPLVKTESQSVVTSLLRHTAYLLRVRTMTPWHHDVVPRPPSIDASLAEAMLLLGDGEASGMRGAKRRILRRALLLAASSMSSSSSHGGEGAHRSASSSVDSLHVHVMLSYTLAMTVTVAALCRMGCDARVTRHASAVSEFIICGVYHGARLSFATRFQGDAPCKITFFHPTLLSMRVGRVRKFWQLVHECRDMVEEFERRVLLWECASRGA